MAYAQIPQQTSQILHNPRERIVHSAPDELRFGVGFGVVADAAVEEGDRDDEEASWSWVKVGISE